MKFELPEFLIKKLENQYGKSISEKIIEGYSKNRKVTFRVNTLKSSSEKILKVLEENNIKYRQVSWSKEAFILESATESEIEKLAIYKNGEIYLQSLSSMLPPIILNPEGGKDILDMAAAPGGKTTQIAALTQNKAHITACEMNNIRIEKLKYNIEKQGATSVYVMKKDSRNIDNFFSFDQILLDAPCSGSGTINLNDEVKITENFIEKISKTQFDLLNKAVKVLKKGSSMVYSTCSILYEENEKQIEKILNKNNVEIIPINLEKMEDIPLLESRLKGTLLLAPNELYEGFFVAKLKKKG